MNHQIIIGLVLSILIIAANLPGCIIKLRRGDNPSGWDQWGIAIGITSLVFWITRWIFH